MLVRELSQRLLWLVQQNLDKICSKKKDNSYMDSMDNRLEEVKLEAKRAVKDETSSAQG